MSRFNDHSARNTLLRQKHTVDVSCGRSILRFTPRLFGSTIDIFDNDTGVLTATWLFADAPEPLIVEVAKGVSREEV